MLEVNRLELGLVEAPLDGLGLLELHSGKGGLLLFLREGLPWSHRRLLLELEHVVSPGGGLGLGLSLGLLVLLLDLHLVDLLLFHLDWRRRLLLLLLLLLFETNWRGNKEREKNVYIC